jgi:hypothetical protein
LNDAVGVRVALLRMKRRLGLICREIAKPPNPNPIQVDARDVPAAGHNARRRIQRKLTDAGCLAATPSAVVAFNLRERRVVGGESLREPCTFHMVG